MTLIAQWYQDDELISAEQMQSSVFSTDIAHIDITGLAYGKKVNWIS